jgi:hypothetical protein
LLAWGLAGVGLAISVLVFGGLEAVFGASLVLDVVVFEDFIKTLASFFFSGLAEGLEFALGITLADLAKDFLEASGLATIFLRAGLLAGGFFDCILEVGLTLEVADSFAGGFLFELCFFVDFTVAMNPPRILNIKS